MQIQRIICIFFVLYHIKVNVKGVRLSCAFDGLFCDGWNVTEGSYQFVDLSSSSATNLYSAPDFHVFASKLGEKNQDKFLLLKNTGNGVRLMIDNEGDTFNHINKSLVSVVVTIHIFSSPNRKIVLQGQAKDGSIVNLWVKKTSPQFKLHVISFQVNLQGLTALWWQSDAQQVGIGDLSITTILTPSTLCDFSTGTICDLETEANPEDYEIRRDFTFQTDREDLHHIPWNWDAQAEKEQSMMKDREQKYLTLTDGLADVLQQSPPLSYLVVRNRKLIRLSWPLKNIKDFKKRRQMNFEFLYYKKFETQSKVRLFVQTDVGLKIIWDSFHEAAFERHPWRAVLASLNVETVQLVRSWFEIEGDNLNALSQIYRSITFHVNLNPLRSSFQISLNYFERLQAPYSGGFLVGPLLLQDPSVLSLRRTQLNYNLLAYADFTGPFAPNHTGQLAWNEKVAANHMELLSQPLHVDYRSEGCIEMEVVIWTNTSNEDQIDSPQTPAFELNINLLYSHREQRLARLFTTNEKLGRLYIPVHFIDQGRILFQAIRLQSERYGMIGVRNFAYFPGNCSKLKWFRLKNSKTITPANRTNVAALRDISCDFTSDFCGWRNDPNLGRWQSWKGNAETREKWKTSISKDTFVYVSNENVEAKNSSLRARFESPMVEPESSNEFVVFNLFCVELTYHLQCDFSIDCNIRLDLIDGETLMYISHDTETAGDWQTSRVTFTRGDPFRIIVDAFIPFTGEAAIKTIRVTSGQCDMRKSFDLIGSNDVEGESSATLSPILCTFETDKCDFFDGSLQSLRWLAADQLDAFDAALNNMSNQMPPPDAARPTDHTTGTSRGRVLAFQVTTNALYMDATTSLTLPDRVNRCVSFWLQVNAMCSVHWQTNTINGSTLLWFYSPTYPDREWYRFEFEIGTAQDDIHGDIRLTFQTNCRSGYQSGFVALDDVEIRAGSCAQDHFCNFEQDNCGWQSISSTSTQSNLTYLTTQNEETHVNLSHRRVQRMLAKHQLPYFDSTTRSENGHFLEIPNGVTAFRSPKIRFNENVKEYCLNFYYYYGIFGSQLELPVLIGTGDQRLLLQLGTLILTKTDGWNLATLTIKPDLDLWSSKRLKQLSQTLKSDDERNAYKFYSVWDKYWNVYILFDLKLAMSVDDISIEKGICESSSVFYCDSGLTVSVSRNKVCNQHVDCWNGADEINCGSCVFNQTLCEYQQVKKAMGSFEMASANSKVDLGRIRYPSDSNYLYTKGLNGTPMNQFAGIVSPTIQRTYRRCRLSFDYAIDNVRLMVGIRFLNEITFRIVWMDLKDHLEPVSVTIPLRSLRSPFKIEFRAVSRIGSGYAALSNLRMMDCEMLDTRNDPAYRVAYEAVDGSNVDHPVEWKDVGEIPSTLSEHLLDSARQRWFQCSNGNRISAELSCNYEDDCEDNSDELSYLCDKRAVRMSFNEPSVATAGVQMSGFVIHQPLSGFLSLPNLDHTRSDTIGYAMIASKASLQWSSFMQPNLHSKSTLHATGLITIDLLVIQGTCSLRFAYWKRGDDIRLSVKWREIVGEPVRGSKSIELLEPQQDWQLIQVPLHEFIGNRVVRLSLQAQLSHNSNAILLLDDLSTSADCHKLSSNPLKCTLLGRKSENCGWHLEASSLANRSVELADKLMKKIKLNPLIDVAQFYTALQVRPRTDLISRRGTTTGVFRMQSLRIPFDLGSKFSITFEYRLQAFGRVDVYLLDLVNQKHLLHIQHQSSSAYERICFSLKEHTIRTTEHLELQVQLQGRHSEFWLKEIMPSLLECDPSNLCDFSSQSYERQCQYMTDQSPFGSHHFLNSLSDPLFQLPDHSLHSDASGFLYAKSSQSGSSDQSYRLELSSDSSIYGSCIQFAYTSGRIDGHTGRLIQTASDSLQSDSFGEIELKMMKVNNLKPLFKLSSNLNWQWRSATILVPRRIKPELQFVATFRANQLNTSFDQVFAIDDIRIADMQTARTLCRVGTCAFDSESMCGWTNPMSDLPLLANGNHDLHDHDVDLAFALPNPQQVSWVLIESLSDLFENFPSPALNSSKPGIGAVFDKLNQTAQLVSVQRTYGQLSERLTIRCNASPRSVFEVRVLQKEGNRQRTLNVSQIGGSDDWRKIKVMLPHLRSEQQATHTVIEVRSLRSTTSREAEKGKSTAFVISDIVIQKVLSSSEDVDDEQDDDEKMRRQQDGGQEWQQDVVVIREPLDQHPTSGHSSRSPALHSKWFVSFAVVIWLQLILLLV